VQVVLDERGQLLDHGDQGGGHGDKSHLYESFYSYFI
jgi:hypothetical protein